MPPTRRLFVAILICIASTLTARAEITLDPPQPQAGQPFRIVISGVWGDSCVPELRRTLIANEIVYASFGLSDSVCLSASTPYDETIEIPGLSAGTYTLRARLIEFDRPRPFIDYPFAIAGEPSGITSVTPSFDHGAGNRVIVIRGSFPCIGPAPCPTPRVVFGNLPSEDVEQVTDTVIHATAPWQRNVGAVDIRVKGATYEHVRHNAFRYVDDVTFVPVMFPVVTRTPVPGAHGSLWQSDLRMVNRTKLELVPGIDIFPLEPRCAGCDAPIPFDRMTEPRFAMPLIDNDRPPVQLAWVDDDLESHLSFSLRVRDLSRQAESWGTEIPVVRNRDFKHDFRLLDIPMQPRFRQLLRLYTPDYVYCCRARIRFFAADGTELAERLIELTRPDGSLGGLVPPPYLREGSRHFPLQPGYGDLDLATVPELAGHTSIWLEATGSFRMWGFVSITNDDTQQVTTITPQ